MSQNTDVPPKVGQQGEAHGFTTWGRFRPCARFAVSAGVVYMVLTGRLDPWTEWDLDPLVARMGAVFILAGLNLAGGICVIAPDFARRCMSFKGKSALELHAQIASITAFVLACALVALLVPAISAFQSR